mmetsp:Transcript_39800/g.69935  ORF Transcript_39800/g.69935 Transcript_39800/m.69935 type:complete len:330 (+) Transcript_39800:49-1038(+)
MDPLSALDCEAGVFICTLSCMGIQSALRLQMASATWQDVVRTRLEAVKEGSPKMSPFRCIKEKSIDLLWANTDDEWTKLRGENGNTLLHAAVVCSRKEILEFVCSLPGAAKLVNVQNGANKAPIHLSASSGRGLDRMLTLPGLDVEQRDNYDATALLIATREEHHSCVASLLQYRADVNAFAMYTGPRLATALAVAVSLNDQKLVDLLLCSPDLHVSKPLLLGVPGAPTARDFAKSERIRQLLAARAAQEGSEAVDEGFFPSVGIPSPKSTGAHAPVDHGQVLTTAIPCVDVDKMQVEMPMKSQAGESAIIHSFWQRAFGACAACLPCR